MDRAAIEELFAYAGWAWDRLERVIDNLPPGTFEAPVPGSGWPAIKDWFEHVYFAFDGHINYEWKLGEPVYHGPETITDWTSAKSYRLKVRDRFRQAMDVPDDILFRKEDQEYEFGPESWSRADMLTNLVIHERGHHGDLNTLFHQIGVKSYFIDYRFFVTLPDRFLMDEPEPSR